MNKYYLWDWYGTRTIKVQDMEFHSKEYAESQNCFTTFKKAKAHGIACLKQEITSLENDLAELQALEIKDIENEGKMP